MHFGLLGKTLGHSYSPAIHALLGSAPYGLFEKSEAELPVFLKNGGFRGLNVTIPYKKAVVPYCAELSDTARALGSVNTIVRRADGTLYGDNTDYYGFMSLVRQSGIDPKGKKALVLGSGGASVTVCAVLGALGAEVVVISRSGADNYDNLARHADARILVNTTPVGMYPHNGAAAVNLQNCPDCEAVFDLIYNPARTALMLQAESLGIPCFGGLHMLVAQAKRSSEQFQNRAIGDSETLRIEGILRREMQNIVLIGMPGCGKSTVARRLGAALNRQVWDSDALVEEMAGMPIPEIFARYGEEEFRRLETQVLAALGKRSGIIIATGGGCVKRQENYAPLHQNGVIFWLQRDLAALPTDGRPLSQQNDLAALYAQRAPLYARFADHCIDNNGAPETTVNAIKEALE
ncbi:MAG: shikimate kinase [Oscillospiraceae bacterium]|nr:shikimate kinase [Oscillospiraceae bacterium]